MKTFEMKQIKTRNVYAKELHNTKYHQRVVPSFKKYNRAVEKRNILKEMHV